jgi:hypothetical protein
MTFAHKAARYCLAVLFVPLLFLGAETGAAPIQSTRIPPSEHTEIRQLTMEFRHPVADGTLMRMIWQIDGFVKDAFSAEEIAKQGLNPDALIPCLAEFVAKEFTNGRRLDIRERYIPWTPELASRLHAIIAAQNLAAENDYGARAETVTNPAYNILIAYADGRSLYITSEGQTLNEHEEGIEDALLTWADAAFVTGGKQMP